MKKVKHQYIGKIRAVKKGHSYMGCHGCGQNNRHKHKVQNGATLCIILLMNVTENKQDNPEA